MADGGGDIPAWAALALSVIVFARQIYTERDIKRRNCNESIQRQVERIGEKLDDIERQSWNYWTTSPGQNDAYFSLTLSSSIKQLADQITKASPNIANTLKSQVAPLRRSLTGGQFQQHNRDPLPPSSPKIKAMENQLAQFRAAIASV